MFPNASRQANFAPDSQTAGACLQFLAGPTEAVQRRLEKLLADPALEMNQRSSHRFRERLVSIGFELFAKSPMNDKDRKNLALCARSIEFLHLGSLVVDDIQDGSLVRREAEALHCRLGIPHALGVGNWLYFYALRLLDDIVLDDSQLLRLQKRYHRAIELAHYGQIIDIAAKVDQIEPAELSEICNQCARFKTGSIVALALSMGAMIAGADKKALEALDDLGEALGLYLQRMNDLGDLIGSSEKEKQLEDLAGRKPSYVWASAYFLYGEEGFNRLLDAAAALPDRAPLYAWLRVHDIVATAGKRSDREFSLALERFTVTSGSSSAALNRIKHLKERIGKAYV